ncbi:MAG: hypothetical protein M3P91_01930 [Actinomycetota bacterium]|nr:hypothetical protein [Actinomycetota bacterium]
MTGKARSVGSAVLRLDRLCSGALLIAAVVTELCKPPAARTRHGRVAGAIPYDFRRPTVERVRRRIWAPENTRIFTPAVFGAG